MPQRALSPGKPLKPAVSLKPTLLTRFKKALSAMDKSIAKVRVKILPYRPGEKELTVMAEYSNF